MSSIRGQLTRKLLAWFALPLMLGELAVFLMMNRALVRQFDGALRAKAMAVATVTRLEEGGIKVSSADRFMREFDGADGGDTRDGAHGDREPSDALVASAFFQMWSSDGTSVQRSESLGSNMLALPARTSGFWNMTLPSRRPGRAVAFQFSPWAPRSQRPAAALLLVVASGRGDLDRTRATLAALLGTCGLVLLAATSVAVPWVLQRELAPLDAMTAHAAGIDADTLASRFATGELPSELLPIATRLNDLLSRLERSFERERQFSADLAHELRTPIAELRSIAELALKWPERRDARTDHDTLQIAVQMGGIVAGLLQLLRGEPGRETVPCEAVVIGPLMACAWEALEVRAAARHLRVTWAVPDTAVVQANPALLQSVLSNLFENAVEYAPEHSDVGIKADVVSMSFVLRVTNDAGTLRPDHLPRLFDRFWRRDPARPSSGHYGLGLAIARAFARSMGWELAATLDAGTRVTVTLSGPESPSG